MSTPFTAAEILARSQNGVTSIKAIQQLQPAQRVDEHVSFEVQQILVWLYPQ